MPRLMCGPKRLRCARSHSTACAAPFPSLASTTNSGLPCWWAHRWARRVPMETDNPPLSVMMRVASLSRTFHSVRWRGCRPGVSLRWEYFARRPGGSGKSSAQPPFGHQPPQSRPRSMATSSAARSTPVWPPLMIFMPDHVRTGRENAIAGCPPVREHPRDRTAATMQAEPIPARPRVSRP